MALLAVPITISSLRLHRATSNLTQDRLLKKDTTVSILLKAKRAIIRTLLLLSEVITIESPLSMIIRILQTSTALLRRLLAKMTTMVLLHKATTIARHKTHMSIPLRGTMTALLLHKVTVVPLPPKTITQTMRQLKTLTALCRLRVSKTVFLRPIRVDFGLSSSSSLLLASIGSIHSLRTTILRKAKARANTSHHISHTTTLLLPNLVPIMSVECKICL